MKRIIYVALMLVFVSSCGIQSVIVPKATNTISTASFKDLNLERSNYEILTTEIAEAVVVYNEKGNSQFTIKEINGEFELKYYIDAKKLNQTCEHKGVVRLGYLSNDYSYDPNELLSAECLARRVAIYRIINSAKLQGVDGIIEPIISTNVEQKGDQIYFKSSVVAKFIKLK